MTERENDRVRYISIHAPRAGSDGPWWCRPPPALHFNPRSPCGERLHRCQALFRSCSFQSTLPVRGATTPKRPLSCCLTISIHAPRAGSDQPSRAIVSNPLIISIHAPRAGSDSKDAQIFSSASSAKREFFVIFSKSEAVRKKFPEKRGIFSSQNWREPPGKFWGLGVRVQRMSGSSGE